MSAPAVAVVISIVPVTATTTTASAHGRLQDLRATMGWREQGPVKWRAGRRDVHVMLLSINHPAANENRPNGCAPLSRFRDSLPPRHGRAARHRASGFIASESVSICTNRRGCQAALTVTASGLLRQLPSCRGSLLL